MRMTRLMAAGATVFLVSAPIAAAQETWTCTAIEECRSDDGTCRSGENAQFPFGISADGKTSRMTTPAFDLTLASSTAASGTKAFETVTDDGTFAVLLEADGTFQGLWTQEIFGTMVEHRLSATCKKAAG